MKTRRKHKRSSSKHSKKHNKSQKKKDGLAKVNCSPNPNKKGFTCYSDNALFKMKKLWNIRHHRDKIKSNDPKLIWNSLKKKMLTKESRIKIYIYYYSNFSICLSNTTMFFGSFK